MAYQDWQDWRNWHYIGEKLIGRKVCGCGKGFTCKFIQTWKHNLKRAKRKRLLITYDCRDNCHQKA